MAGFYGEYRAKVDDKGRVVFPSAFKALFGSDDELKFIIKPSLYSSCLEMYTRSEWDTSSEEVRSRLNMFNREHAAFWREYNRGAAPVEPDGKIGRINIPKNLAEGLGIVPGMEVVFFGSGYFIEIWPKEQFDATRMRPCDYTALAEKLLG